MAETQQHPGKTGHWQRLPRWKKWLLAIALVFTGVGGAFAGYNAITASGGAHATRDSSDRPSIKADDEAERRLSQGLAPGEDSGSGWPTLPSLPGDSSTGDTRDGEDDEGGDESNEYDHDDSTGQSSTVHIGGRIVLSVR